MNNGSTSILTTPASIDPVTRAEFKQHQRIDFDDEDALIDSLISAATRICQDRIGQQFINASWTLKLDSFPCWEIVLPRSPISSVTSITYNDANGTSTVLSSANYRVDSSRPCRIEPAYGYVWPWTRGQTHDVSVLYVAGYGATTASVPETLRAAVKLMASHLYEHRDDSEEIPDTIAALLNLEWDGAIF